MSFSVPTARPSSVGDSPITEGDDILSRVPLALEIIEKEYIDFNTKHVFAHSRTKSKRTIPQLFYNFAQSTICSNFILAMYAYLSTFLRTPIVEGETLTAAAAATSSARSGVGAVAVNTKLAHLQHLLIRVSEAYSAILIYRSDCNRVETITISKVMKKTEHFLNDTFDALFFETLALLVEYTLEFRFMDAHTRMVGRGNDAHASKASSAAPSPSVDGGASNGIPASASASASASTVTGSVAQPPKPTTKLPLLPDTTESDWRLVQHELQRLLRSRNFNYSMKHIGTRRRGGNGLNHLPLGGAHGQHTGSNGVRKHGGVSSKNSASYRNPATFSLFGVRKWNDPPVDIDDLDDTRALSHLPGQFRQKGQQSILDCLDLRSPLVAAVLPNRRTMAAANDRYVFGTEERRANAKRKYHGRLTHAEEKYLTEQHARQAKREAEWKARIEREAIEEREKEEAEESKRNEEHQRITRATQELTIADDDAAHGDMHGDDTGVVGVEESKEESGGTPGVLVASSSSGGALPADSMSVGAIPPLRLPPQPTPPSNSRPLSAHRLTARQASIAAAAASTSPSLAGTTASVPPIALPLSAASRSARLQANIAAAAGHAQTSRTTRHTPNTYIDTNRAATFDEKLASTRPIIRLDRTSNRISLIDFHI